MSCARPPYRCSGPRTSVTRTPRASRICRAWTSRRSTDAGCASRPTRWFLSSAPSLGCVARRSSPVRMGDPSDSTVRSNMRRVLVVDDEENIRLVLRTLLKKHGYEVEIAEEGEGALAALDSVDPDVILTDVRMPRVGGLDLLAALKAKQHPDTVIGMSAAD